MSQPPMKFKVSRKHHAPSRQRLSPTKEEGMIGYTMRIFLYIFYAMQTLINWCHQPKETK